MTWKLCLFVVCDSTLDFDEWTNENDGGNKKLKMRNWNVGNWHYRSSSDLFYWISHDCGFHLWQLISASEYSYSYCILCRHHFFSQIHSDISIAPVEIQIKFNSTTIEWIALIYTILYPFCSLDGEQFVTSTWCQSKSESIRHEIMGWRFNDSTIFLQHGYCSHSFFTPYIRNRIKHTFWNCWNCLCLFHWRFI